MMVPYAVLTPPKLGFDVDFRFSTFDLVTTAALAMLKKVMNIPLMMSEEFSLCLPVSQN